MNTILFSSRKYIAKILIFVYSAIIVLGFVHFVHMFSMPDNHCTTMPDNHKICTALTSPTQSEISKSITSLFYIAMILMSSLFVFLQRDLFTALPRWEIYSKDIFPPPYIQELFSSGILNPKIY